MEVKLQSGAAGALAADLLIVGIFNQEKILDVLKTMDKLDQAFVAQLATMAAEDGFAGRLGQQLVLPTYGKTPFKRLMLFGLGAEADVTLSTYRKLGILISKKITALNNAQATATHNQDKAAAKKNVKASVVKNTAVKTISLLMRGAVAKSVSKPVTATVKKDKGEAVPVKKTLDGADCLSSLVEAWILSSFNFAKYKTKEDDKRAAANSSTNCVLHVMSLDLNAAQIKRAVFTATAMAEATNMARELIAEPPAVMTPTRLAQAAVKIAADNGLSCKILEPEQVKKLGMGAFLGVARGAKEPLRLIVLKYNAAKTKKTIGLIGKGITFDSGGLSLKTAVGMEHMKYDMAGAAAVLAAMQIIAKLKPDVSVLAVMAATENMPGSAALHPGDVLTSMNGKTIEVNNTDAEGRLVLADAITYALREGADEIIDIATLTGAVVSALGRVAAGIMGSNQKLVNAVIESGARSGEQFWQLPLFPEYKDALKSDIADLKNAGSRGEAGSSAAGMFLKEFAEGKPWAHLDIAGMAWLDRERDEFCKGGTGFGARTLVNYVLSQGQKSS